MKQQDLMKQRKRAHEAKRNPIGVRRSRMTWTRLEEADLIRYHNEGHPWEDIGETLGRTATACRVRIAVLRNDGVEGIDRRSGVMDRHNFTWTVAEDKQLIHLCQEGETYENISEEMGRTEAACSVRASVLNVAVVRNAASTDAEEDDTTIQTTLDDFQTVASEPQAPAESQPVASNNMQFILGALTMLAGIVVAKWLEVGA